MSTASYYPAAFEELWEAYPRRTPDNPKRMAYKAWLARIKEGTTPETLLACTKEYAHTMGSMGKIGTPYVMQACTFLGPNARFEDFLPAPKSAHEGPVGNGRLAGTKTSRPDGQSVQEERFDARPFLRELMQTLAGAKGLPR